MTERAPFTPHPRPHAAPCNPQLTPGVAEEALGRQEDDRGTRSGKSLAHMSEPLLPKQPTICAVQI